jgi:hypothetical protein
MQELTTAQRVLFETINSPKHRRTDDTLSLEQFQDMIFNEFNEPTHGFFQTIQAAMHTYGELKWNEACNTLRPLESNPMIMHDFFVNHVNPEFKP